MKQITLLTILFFGVSMLNAQIYQNKLLGIPNGNVINFNRTPVAINELPKHPYILQSDTYVVDTTYDAGETINPFDEDFLYECFYSTYFDTTSYSNLFTQYRGQFPKFCQTIVNDRDSNLLFFIIDNNIYNSEGISFHDLNSTNYDGTGDEFAYLLNANNILKDDGTKYYDYNKDINRFVDGHEDIIIHNKVIVVPFPDNCNKFHIFFMEQENENGQSSPIDPHFYIVQWIL